MPRILGHADQADERKDREEDDVPDEHDSGQDAETVELPWDYMHDDGDNPGVHRNKKPIAGLACLCAFEFSSEIYHIGEKSLIVRDSPDARKRRDLPILRRCSCL